MKTRIILGFVAAGLLLGTVALGAQAPALPQGAAMPGPPVTRPQTPGGPTRDNPQMQPATGTGKIVGRVVSGETGLPLRRAQVRITAAEQRVMKSATTDAEGRYQFVELPAGRYSVNVSRNGYVTLQFGQQRSFEPGKPLELADGQVAEKIDFALPRGGVIAGRITDEIGEPLAGVSVRAMRYQYQPNGQRRLTPGGGPMIGPGGTQTDDLGQFRIYGLMPGAYVVSASVNGMGGAIVMPMPGGGMVTSIGANDGSDGYASTFYPGTANENDAQSVTVGIGQEASAFFSMIPARLSRISGFIRDSQGRPAAGVSLALRMTTQGGGFSAFGGTTGPDGAFMLQNVPPGEHLIDVRPMTGRPGVAAATDGELASVPVTVAGSDITGLVITTGPGASIAGRVILENASGQALAQLMTGPQPLRVGFAADQSMPGGGMMFTPDNGVPDGAGHFQMKGLSGRGLFRLGAPNWFLKSVTLEGVDITDMPHEMRPGANLSGLEITLTNRVTTLSGTVRSLQGQNAKDYVLAIFPINLREGESPARFIRTARPNQDGKYETKGLPPGEYFAAAVESLEQGGQFDPAFQEQVKGRAKRFQLSEGESMTLDLQLLQ